MDAKNADLSALRINRAERDAERPPRRVPLWAILGAAALVVAVLLLVVFRGAGGGMKVRLTPATLVSPTQANVVVIASGYVVAQRKAAVASKVQNNQFTIRTDRPGVEVSWQVTGVRNDLHARNHPFVAERPKTGVEVGSRFHPEDYNLPRERGLGTRRSAPQANDGDQRPC